MKIYQYLRLHIKIICQRFCSIILFSFWDIRTRDIWSDCLQTYRNNRVFLKVAYFLRKIQTSRVNNSRIIKFKNANFQRIVFTWVRLIEFYIRLACSWQTLLQVLRYIDYLLGKGKCQPHCSNYFVRKHAFRCFKYFPEFFFTIEFPRN